jgi:hypothetical protein
VQDCPNHRLFAAPAIVVMGLVPAASPASPSSRPSSSAMAGVGGVAAVLFPAAIGAPARAWLALARVGGR